MLKNAHKLKQWHCRHQNRLSQMKYAVLSTDNNPDYYNLLPLVCHSWRKIGYTPVILFVNVPYPTVDTIMRACPGTSHQNYTSVEGVKDSTVAQVLRLWSWRIFKDDDIMLTSDADMAIAKDIFNCNEGFTSYGFDLTGRSEIPICYNIAKVSVWRQMIPKDNSFGFEFPAKSYSDKWEDYWSVDQQLLTQRAHEYGMEKITFVDRLHNHPRGLPTGRWDRHCWDVIPDDIIDVHMKRNSWEAQYQVAERLWPGEDHSFITKFKEALDGTVR